MQRGYNFVGRSFGVFNLELPEDYVFCFAGSDKAPESPVLAGTSRAVSIDRSFNELALAFSRRPGEVFNGLAEKIESPAVELESGAELESNTA